MSGATPQTASRKNPDLGKSADQQKAVDQPKSPKPRKSLDLPRLLLQLAVFALVIGGWSAYIRLAQVPPYLLPGPAAVARELWELAASGQLWVHTGVTLVEIGLGFLAGVVTGALVGYVLARWRRAEELFQAYILFAQTAPKIALIPLFVIWFGLGLVSKVVLVASMVFFPVMVNTILGLRSVPAELHELMSVLKASPFQRLVQVELPSALPLFMAGLRLGMIQAVIGAIVSEWISGKSGLGYLLIFGSTTYDSALLVASIAGTSLLGVGCYLLVLAVERRVLRWHESAQWETEV